MLSHIFHMHILLAIIETTSCLVQLRILGFQLTDLHYFRFRRLASKRLLIEIGGRFQGNETSCADVVTSQILQHLSGVAVLVTGSPCYLKLLS